MLEYKSVSGKVSTQFVSDGYALFSDSFWSSYWVGQLLCYTTQWWAVNFIMAQLW